MKNNLRIFLISVAGSWLVLGCGAALAEYWQPNFVDYLVPLWLIWGVVLVAGSGALLISKK